MKHTYRLAKLGSFDFENGTTDDRESVTVAPFGKTLSGRTVRADVDDDKLRLMLDVRGVKWDSVFDDDTSWKGRYGIKWRYTKDEDSATGYLFARITPEQAIIATLGGNGMKHVFEDYEGNELCIMDDGGYEAVNYIRELDSYIADVTAGKDDITAEDEARIFAMNYAVQCSVNTLCKAIRVKLSKFDIISGHFTS